MTNIKLNPNEMKKLVQILENYQERPITIQESSTNGIGKAISVKIETYDHFGRECSIMYDITDYSSW